MNWEMWIPCAGAARILLLMKGKLTIRKVPTFIVDSVTCIHMTRDGIGNYISDGLVY
jgi:hypothetical protein